MADQTEQEPIDPWRVVARWHRDGDGCDDLGCAEDHWSYWSDIDVARAADAALLRERDAQIARKETALNMWRGWAHFVYLKGGPITLDDEALRAAVCVVHDDETATLRAERDDARAACMEWDRLHKRAIAERDAAQQQIAEKDAHLGRMLSNRYDADVVELRQQIATLTEALTQLRDCDWAIGRGDRMDAVRGHRPRRSLVLHAPTGAAMTMCERCGNEQFNVTRVTVEADAMRRAAWLCVPCARVIKAAVLFVWPVPTCELPRENAVSATHQQGGHQP